jgi:hypothetical protein
MSWLPASHRPESHAGPAQEAILANVHRGLLLAIASRRLQDSISSQRASEEARHLLSTAQRLCEETPDLDTPDDRVRAAIAALARALEPQ